MLTAPGSASQSEACTTPRGGLCSHGEGPGVLPTRQPARSVLRVPGRAPVGPAKATASSGANVLSLSLSKEV